MFALSKNLTISGLLFSAITLGTSSSVFATPAADTLTQVADAMGGAQIILNSYNQSEYAKVSGFAPLQAPTPGGTAESFDGIEYHLTRALDGQRYRTQWMLDIDFPLASQYQFSEIINNDQGAVIGIDSILQAPQAPMQSIRLAARQVFNLVSSPVELVKTMLSTPQQVTQIGHHESSRKKLSVLSLRKFDKQFLLWIDNNTHLPTHVSYWDSNPSYGDVNVVTRFSNWQAADGILVPMLIEQSYHDELLIRIERQSVDFNLSFIQDPYSIPHELSAPLDNRAYQIGLKYSQWFHRYLLVGIPFDLNQFTTDSVFLQPVGNGVFYLQGFTHHSLIVEMDDYLILFDPVLLEERTQVVLPLIKQQWPNKKIKYVIPTHFHTDHSGGLRGYVADGAKLVTIENNKKFYKDVLKAKHIIYPDLLSLVHSKARMLELDDKDNYILEDGNRRVHLLQIDNRHAPGLIVPYIEDEKMIFVSDLYSPGLSPAPLPAQFSFWGLDLYKDLLPRDLAINKIIGAHGGMGSYEDFKTLIESTFPGNL